LWLERKKQHPGPTQEKYHLLTCRKGFKMHQ
jgi:hypothetical protein